MLCDNAEKTTNITMADSAQIMCYLSLGKINDTFPKCRVVFWIIPIQTSGDGHHRRSAIINVTSVIWTYETWTFAENVHSVWLWRWRQCGTDDVDMAAVAIASSGGFDSEYEENVSNYRIAHTLLIGANTVLI